MFKVRPEANGLRSDLRPFFMINKVVVAAAGQGTRMKHLTKNKSKHLICVQKKPFLAYLFDNLCRAGYADIILVTGFRSDLVEEFIRAYLKESPFSRQVKLTIVNQFEILGPKEKEYGTLCPLKCVKDIVGQDQFIAVYGDNLYSVKDLKAINLNDSYCYVAGRQEKEHPEKYGILITSNGFLKEIKEKPQQFVGSLVNTGLYKFTPEVFAKIPQVKLSPRGEYELTDAISLLAREGKVKVKRIEDYWLDFGNPGDILKLNKFLKQQHNGK